MGFSFAPGVGEFLGGLGGGIASGLFGQSSAREQMRFQERMSRTQYQRAAADLEKAGLNRVLALGNPASAPSGASATMPDLGSTFVGAFNARTQRDLSKANIEAAEASAARDNSQTVVNAATAAKTMQETSNLSIDAVLKNLEAEKQGFYKQFYSDLAPLARHMFDSLMSGAQEVGSSAKSLPAKANALGTLARIKAEGAASSVKDVASDNAKTLLGNNPIPLLSPVFKIFEHVERKSDLKRKGYLKK